MTEPDEMDEDGRWLIDDFSGALGCCNCDQGWKHGCMDDMCRSCEEAFACANGHPCKECNPDGEFPA